MKNKTAFLSAILPVAALAAFDPTVYVDPFIGSAGTGHTTPAAAQPFGIIQAGPDTGLNDWKYCSGYQYGDTNVLGFSQTHLSGTGCPDLGDVSILPFCGKDPEKWAFAMDKSTEKASPGRYSVELPGAGVKVDIGFELTAANGKRRAVQPNTVVYRLRYRDRKDAHLYVNLPFGVGYTSSANPWAWCRTEDIAVRTNSQHFAYGQTGSLSGSYTRTCWARDRRVSFRIDFSRPVKLRELPRAEGEEAGKASRYVADFAEIPFPGEVEVAIRIFDGATDGTRGRLAKNPPVDARGKWRELLSRIEIDGTDEQKKSFYTAMYHLFFQPNNISGMGDEPFYSTLSFWDTFRAAHPLYTLIAPEYVDGFVNSALKQGERNGYLPIWPLWGYDTQCMIGTHSVPVIVDWFLKTRSPGVDWNEAYRQVRDTLRNAHPGRQKENWDILDKYGYYPYDIIKGESVSRTLECAYDDWCAAEFAYAMGEEEDAAFFRKRAGNWRNVFDPSVGFARGRDSKGAWRPDFNPFALGRGAGSGNDFTEGNSWQYTWHVMQDPEGLIAALGGREKFAAKLQSLFAQAKENEGQGSVSDVTGLIGQYAHGNEPSHHVIYFFQYAGRGDLTAKYVREVFDTQYGTTPDGLCGNDDCGQMSAWYVFSAMGFYPFNPCGGAYVLGAPQVPRATIRLPGGKSFTIRANNLSKENLYVKSVSLNGRPKKDFILRHADILAGGELVFEMTDKIK